MKKTKTQKEYYNIISKIGQNRVKKVARVARVLLL
jgi:hypothetical protein